MKYITCYLIRCLARIALLVGVLFAHADAAVTFEPRISLGNMYTDNIDLTAEDEEHDFITALSPEINFSITEQFTNLSLFYSPTYASYLRFPENNTFRHDAALDFSRQITRTTRMEFSNGYRYTEDPLSETVEADYDRDTTVRQGREPYTTNTTNLSVINQLGPDNSIALDYEYSLLSNRDPAIEDSNHHRPAITMTYWLVPNRYGTESEVSYTKRDFDVSENYNDISGRLRLIRRITPHFEIYAEYTHELTDYVSETEDYQVFSPVAGFSWDEYIDYRLAASFGYFFRKNDHSGSDSGPVGTIEGLYTWEPGASLLLNASAGYDRASGGSEELGFNPFYDVQGTVTYPIGRHLHANLFTGYRWNIYTEESPDREDTLWRAGAGLAYQALPWMLVQLNYAFQDMNSNVDTEDYTENRAEITVTINPRQPLRLND
jgi:hypothetical protein